MNEIETRQQRRDRARFFDEFNRKTRLCCNCAHMDVVTHHGEIVGLVCTVGKGHETAPNFSCSNNKFTQRK